jgi:hypothetical protein
MAYISNTYVASILEIQIKNPNDFKPPDIR